MNFSIQVPSVDLQVSVLCYFRLKDSELDGNQPYHRKNDDIIVEHHSDEQDAEPNELQEVKLLPANEHTDSPDDEGPNAVQHHPGGGRQLLGHGDPGKVEESNRSDGPWRLNNVLYF